MSCLLAEKARCGLSEQKASGLNRKDVYVACLLLAQIDYRKKEPSWHGASFVFSFMSCL